MKKILFIITFLLSLGAYAQDYKLEQPAVITDTITVLKWHTINYPQSNQLWWGVYRDSTDTDPYRSGNYYIPDSVLNKWGTDDSVIPKHLADIQIWNRKENQ